MKKMVASLATGFIIVGAAATSASAAEYKVESGDTLWNIADDHSTSVDQIVKTNKLNGTIIYPSQVLTVGAQATNVNNVEYKVVKGDSLSKIASNKGVSVASIKQWNNLSSDLIIEGQTLYLEAGHTQATTAQAPQAQTQEAPKQAAAQPAPAKQAPAAPAPAAKPAQQQTSAPAATSGKKVTVETTAYTAKCNGCSGVTATGVDLNANPNAKVIAVDPSVIPLGSKVHVPGYGTAIAADTGGAIKGNRIDVHVPTHNSAINWGRKSVTVTILD